MTKFYYSIVIICYKNHFVANEQSVELLKQAVNRSQEVLGMK